LFAPIAMSLIGSTFESADEVDRRATASLDCSDRNQPGRR
jgi:hypothetical protein